MVACNNALRVIQILVVMEQFAIQIDSQLVSVPSHRLEIHSEHVQCHKEEQIFVNLVLAAVILNAMLYQAVSNVIVNQDLLEIPTQIVTDHHIHLAILTLVL